MIIVFNTPCKILYFSSFSCLIELRTFCKKFSECLVLNMVLKRFFTSLHSVNSLSYGLKNFSCKLRDYCVKYFRFNVFSYVREYTNSHLASKADKSVSFPPLKEGISLIAVSIDKVMV